MSQDFGKNLNHETEFIIKNNESLTKHKTKIKTEQLLSKYTHGNKHQKVAKRINHTNFFLTNHKD